ncbi:MAG: hypothetical protein CL910_01130 [Deltaproteobacteria bacterium]|nr:hypothetical protein [Deltaproteobacteria bacterium]
MKGLRCAALAGLLLGATSLGCWQTSYGVPAWQVAIYAGQFIVEGVVCFFTGCPVELAEGMVLADFETGLLPDVPVAIEVDEWGRVYVAEGGRINGGAEDNRFHSAAWLMDDLASHSIEDRRAYYQKHLELGEFEEPDRLTAISDRLIRLDDSDGDGKADTVHELARWNDMLNGPAAGVIAREGDLWVTEIPSVWHLRDEDGDGVAEIKTPLSTGYGVKTSLVGHDLHGLVWGPDGKLYFSMGDRGYNVVTQEGRRLKPTMGPGRGAVFRMNADGSELEVFATGVRNPQELAFDDYGNLFTGDNNGDGGDKARVVYLVDGGETGWAMPYQTLIGDYVRGPWNAERLWELQHEGQPAWVLPPIAYLAVGPAGFASYPGLGLPERYDGHFFLCDYRYQAALSGIWSFALEPKGAHFELRDEHTFVGALLPTDVDFGYDGRIYVSRFDQILGGQSIAVLHHETASLDPRLAETARLVQEGMKERPVGELSTLLGHPDRRVRLRAQFELARRTETSALLARARDSEASLVERLHGLWGLGQLGADAIAQLGADFTWTDGAPDELRAQAARVAGEAGAHDLGPVLIADLDHPEARVRFFAAQSLGRLKAREAVDPLVELLRRNADRDVYLRHAAAWALHRIADDDALLRNASDESRSVRLGVLLALRHAGDARIARYLADPDPFLVLEAARAIHDLPIEAALPALAALPPERLPSGDDPQASYALHRRVVGANRALGTEAGALALAAHAANPKHPEPMRRLALEALAEYSAPGPRDLATGFHRPLPERPPSVVYAALDRHGPALIDGELGGRALEVALSYERVPLDDDALAAQVAKPGLPTDRRVAALRVLAQRGTAATRLPVVLEEALSSDAPELRAEARDVLAEHDPAAALRAIEALGGDAPLRERQRALATAGGLRGAEPYLLGFLGQLERGELDPAVHLDVLEASRSRQEAALARALLAWERAEAERHGGDMVEPRRWALAGGDPDRGRLVFQGAGDCQRCHAGAGHGGQAGPDLAGVGSRRGARHVLEAVIAPQAEIAPGYATLTLTLKDGEVIHGIFEGEDETSLRIRLPEGTSRRVPREALASRSDLISGMPPMGLALAPRDLRDLLAYVMAL